MLLIWTQKAQNDLKEYIKNSSRSINNVQKYVNKLLEYVNILIQFPKIGKEIEFNLNIQVRQLIFEQHKIIYKIQKDKIYILSVLHTSYNLQDFWNEFLNNVYK